MAQCVLKNTGGGQQPDHRANGQEDIDRLFNSSVHEDSGVYQPNQHTHGGQRHPGGN